MLRDAHLKFCMDYVQHYNKGRAAIAAGYTPKSATQTANLILARQEVKDWLKEHSQQTQLQESAVTIAAAVTELSHSAFLDPARLFHPDTKHLLDITDMAPEVRRCISAIKVTTRRDGESICEVKEIKFNDKLRALDMTLKHLGGYWEDNRQKGLVVAGTVAALMEAIDGRSTPLVQEHVGRVVDITPQDAAQDQDAGPYA